MKLTKSKPYLIAETAFHHEGDLDYMMGLIDAAARSHCDAIKFQVLIDFDYLIHKNHGDYDTLKKFTFTKMQWQEIFNVAIEKKLRIVSLPLDTGAVAFTKENKVKVDLVEIHSVSFYDQNLIDEIKKIEVPVFLGVGGRTIEEVNHLKRFLGKQLWGLIVGFQAFPSDLKDVKLTKITHLQQAYPDLEIGYTDHSGYNDTNAIISNYVALGLGATFFEKHLTLHEGVERTDFQSAIGEEKLKEINDNLTQLATAIYHGANKLDEIEGPEINYRNRQKKAFASQDLEQDTILANEHLRFQMTDIKDKGFYSLEQLVGKRIKKQLQEGAFINQIDIYDKE